MTDPKHPDDQHPDDQQPEDQPPGEQDFDEGRLDESAPEEGDAGEGEAQAETETESDEGAPDSGAEDEAVEAEAEIEAGEEAEEGEEATSPPPAEEAPPPSGPPAGGAPRAPKPERPGGTGFAKNIARDLILVVAALAVVGGAIAWFLRAPAPEDTAQFPEPGAEEQVAEAPPAEPDEPQDAGEPGDEGADTGVAPQEPVEVSQPEPRSEISRGLGEEWSPGDIRIPEAARTGGGPERVLSQAQQALEAGRLMAPEGENALELYLAVLDEEPDNEAAQQGIDNVVARLLDRAQQAADEGRFADALSILPAVENVRPDSERVQQLRARLEEAGRIADHLVAAEQALEDGNLLEPSGDSALAHYRAVLDSEPDNSEARQGLAEVEQQLIERARQMAGNNELQGAERLLNDAATVRKDNSAVEAARRALAARREERLESILSDASQAIDGEAFERARELLEEAEQLEAGDQRIADLRSRITQEQVFAQYQPGDTFADPLSGGGSGPAMVVLPTGSFRMGSPSGESGRRDNEGPVHQVRIDYGLALSRYEVTVDQFERFVEATGYRTDAERAGESRIYDGSSGRTVTRNDISWRHDYRGDAAYGNFPVIHVSWNDAQRYAEWLASQTGERYRLASEAELAYGLRAGTQTRYWWGENAPEDEVENLTGDGDRYPAQDRRNRRSWSVAFDGYRDGYWGPAPVGELEPNPFGLYDMGGNVSEWAADCWHSNYEGAPADGSIWGNAQDCQRHVIRGGSWASSPDLARSAIRLTARSEFTGVRVGFRIAREL